MPRNNSVKKGGRDRKGETRLEARLATFPSVRTGKGEAYQKPGSQNPHKSYPRHP